MEPCNDFNQIELDNVLSRYDNVLLNEPGQTDLVQMQIHVEPGTSVISQAPYRVQKKGLGLNLIQF